ncbi:MULTISPECIES: porin [Burkholderia]|uniref:porin n=1 Tax=Burkholderia TaxID=32008 RepID=UPI00158C8230|nr:MULTISPECIES: porin [Burkholderia]
MKSRNIASGVMLACVAGAIPIGANAQGSVTLSGTIDTGFLYTNNNGGHASWSTMNGALTPSRWILSGVEDIGGGNRTVFRLIHPFSVQNGRDPGRGFNVAYVGLSNDRFGTLTLGRQYDTTIDFVSGFATNGTWAHIGDSDNTNGSFKTSNAAKYVSPTWYGLTLGTTYGFSNQGGGSGPSSGFANNRAIAFGATYSHGPFSSALGFIQLNHPDSQPGGAVGTSGGGTADDYVSMFTKSVTSGANVERERIWLAGASYQIGPVTLNGLYSKVQYRYLDGTGLSLDNYEANVAWQVTPAWIAQVAYIRTNGAYSGVTSATPDPGWDQLNVGAQYLLSKRTLIYLIAIGQQGRNAKAQILNTGQSSTRRQLVVALGIQHRF